MQAGAAYGVRIVSNSRLCEVYSKGPGEGAASYVGTLQGEKEAGVEVAFAHCHQTEVGAVVAFWCKVRAGLHFFGLSLRLVSRICRSLAG